MNLEAIKNVAEVQALIQATKDYLEDFDVVSSSIPQRSVSSGSRIAHSGDARMAHLIDRRDAMRKKLVDLHDSYLQAVEQSMDELMKVKDAGVRAILIWKYVKNYRWDEVAKQMGGNVSADAIKKRVERYFAEAN